MRAGGGGAAAPAGGKLSVVAASHTHGLNACCGGCALT